VIDLLTPATVIDWAIGLTVLEGAALMGYHRWKGRGIAPRLLYGNLLAGIFLMLAARLALRDVETHWVPVFLLAALISHLIDLHSRWRT